MTAPEKIRTNAAGDAIVTPHPVWDTDVEYTRSDVAQAMVAAAYEVAAYECAGSNRGLTVEDVADDIRDHTPADARAALDAMLAKAREDALREAIAACDKALSDMQSANPDRHDALPYIEDGCDACKDAIEALIPTAEGEA